MVPLLIVVVPIAPAKGPGATREGMVGDGSWHEDGEICPTILLCTCWWGAPVLWPLSTLSLALNPAWSCGEPAGWGGEETWGRRGTLTSLAAPPCPRNLLLLKRARKLSYSPSTVCQR